MPYTQQDLLRVARRVNNTKRSYLLVNPLQAKHIPVPPSRALEMMGALGDRLGTLTVTSGEEVVAEIPLLAGEEVPRVTYGQMFLRLLRTACLAG